MENPKKISIYIFLLFLLIYSFIMPGKINHKDGLALYLISESIVENNSFDIIPLPYATKKGINGKYYSPFSIGHPILGIPLYLVGKSLSIFLDKPSQKKLLVKWVYTFFNIVIISLIMTFFFGIHFSIYQNKKYAFYATLLLGTSTIFFHYSQTLFTEPLQALLILISFGCLMKYNKLPQKKYIHIIGFCLGYNTFSKTAGIIYLFPFIVYFFCKDYQIKKWKVLFKNQLILISYNLFFMILIILYNYFRFRNFLDFGGVDMPYLTKLINPVIGIIGFLFNKSKGLFVLMPIFFFLFFSRTKLKKNYMYFILFLFMCSITFHSFFVFWPGAFCWGPRYLMPVIPLLFLMIDFKTIFNATKLKVIFKIIIVMSILFQLLSISINSNSFLAFCKKNNLIYKNTHDLPKISSLKGQYFLIEQNIREFFGMKDLFINGKNLNGYGETMFWQLHLFRFYKSRNLNIFIFIFCFIHLYIITRLFIFIKIQIIEKT